MTTPDPSPLDVLLLELRERAEAAGKDDAKPWGSPSPWQTDPDDAERLLCAKGESMLYIDSDERCCFIEEAHAAHIARADPRTTLALYEITSKLWCAAQAAFKHDGCPECFLCEVEQLAKAALE